MFHYFRPILDARKTWYCLGQTCSLQPIHSRMSWQAFIGASTRSFLPVKSWPVKERPKSFGTENPKDVEISDLVYSLLGF